MTQTLAVQPQHLDYYNYFVMCNYVFNAPEPVIENSYTYEENGVLYCASATQEGVYCYTYARNNPLMYVDPSGEFLQVLIPIIVGAVYGAMQGAIQGAIMADAKDATGSERAKYILGGMGIGFGIGALSGYAGGALSGALSAVGVGGFAGGAISGAASGITSGVITGLGMGALGGKTGKNLWSSVLQGAAMGAITGAAIGGTVQGIASAKAGNNFWTGKPNTPQALAAANPKTTTASTNPTSEAHRTYDASIQESSEIRLPDKLSHYTSEDPRSWTTIGKAEAVDNRIWLTPNSELNSTEAMSQLALKQSPNWRVDIMTTDPTFDASRVLYIQKVDPMFGQAGGGIEVVYKGPLSLDQTRVIITQIK